MYRFKNILLPLKNTAAAHDDIDYGATITRLARSEKAYFVHIASSLDIPDEIKELYPDIIEPADEFAEKKLSENVSKNFSGYADTEKLTSVIEGDVLDQIITLVSRKDIDLVVTKKKSGDDFYKKLPEKLARKAPCSVLIVPDDFKSAEYGNIMVPLDFSDYSKDALDVALAFAKAAALSKITAVNIYTVPTGYHKSGKSYEEFAEIMKQNAEKAFNRFIKEFDTGPVSVEPLFILNDNVSEGVLEAQRSSGADLIVMSTRGRTSGASIIMSSRTEKVIEESPVPVLAVKKKGSGMNFIKALLEI